MTLSERARFRVFKYSVAALCAYEATAIITGRVPTITELGERYRGIKPTIYVGLGFHFWAGWHNPQAQKRKPR